MMEERLKSVWICIASLFFLQLALTILTAGIYPYMKQLLPPDENSTPSEEQAYYEDLLQIYGFITALYPLGQLISMLATGYISSKRDNKVRSICLLLSGLLVLCSTLYSILSLFQQSARLPLLVVIRFLTGVSSGYMSLIYAYVSSATTTQERTRYFSFCMASQCFGAVTGPLLQAAVTPLQCTDKLDEDTYISFDLYTACGWISAFCALCSNVSFNPLWFKEHQLENEDEDKKVEVGKPDYGTIIPLIVFYSIGDINFTVMEVLTTPLAMDEFGWTESEATFNASIIFTVSYFVGFACFLSLKFLSSRFDERLLLIFTAYVPTLAARLLFIPWPNNEHPQTTQNLTEICDGGLEIESEAKMLRNVECKSDENGAPLCSHCWCLDQAALEPWQMVVGTIITMGAFCYFLSLSTSIYTKVLGPRSMALWLGIINSCGAAIRVISSPLVTIVYNATGLYILYGTIAGLMFVCLLGTIILYKRLIPYEEKHKVKERDATT